MEMDRLKLTECEREEAVSAGTFRSVTENFAGLPLYDPDLSPLDILFPPESPATHLGGFKWEWDKHCESAFETVKRLIETDVSTHYERNNLLIVTASATRVRSGWAVCWHGRRRLESVLSLMHRGPSPQPRRTIFKYARKS
ncbi:hypothetical protein EVAR_76704_1 [Eumeta japonica]|uniref:Uncharacterized protein n=1 Tax=Eumeta variegata TaxID=151549 RepID=A0A4C1SVI7_EUMVA|nr:hypothetical protein EVAR_76704_1 [Eumeta japonica]